MCKHWLFKKCLAQSACLSFFFFFFFLSLQMLLYLLKNFAVTSNTLQKSCGILSEDFFFVWRHKLLYGWRRCSQYPFRVYNLRNFKSSHCDINIAVHNLCNGVWMLLFSRTYTRHIACIIASCMPCSPCAIANHNLHWRRKIDHNRAYFVISSDLLERFRVLAAFYID